MSISPSQKQFQTLWDVTFWSQGTSTGNNIRLSPIMPPNKGQKAFFESLLNKLRPHLKGTIVFGGDTNMAFDFSLQSSSSGKSNPKRPSRQSVQLAKILNEEGLIDIPPFQGLYTLLSTPWLLCQDRPHLHSAIYDPFDSESQDCRFSPFGPLDGHFDHGKTLGMQ